MPLQWIDSIKTAIVAKLVAELPNTIAMVDVDRGIAEDSDDATPAPALYATSDLVLPQTLPSCEVICTDSTRVDAENFAPKQYRHSLTVVFTLAGTNEELLDAQMTRLAFAAMLILDGWHVASANIQNGSELIAGGITYDLVQPADVGGRPFIKSGLLALTTDQFL